MKHTLSVYVRNRSGVLSRVAGLFSGRGYNIDSLCVAETNEPGYSLMTIVVSGNDAVIEQINKQLNKLIDVVKVNNINLIGNNQFLDFMGLLRICLDTKGSDCHDF